MPGVVLTLRTLKLRQASARRMVVTLTVDVAGEPSAII
jgi:hypothetical protein